MLLRMLKDILFARPREGRGAGSDAAVPRNPLVEIFERHTGRLTVKWLHYLEIYHRHFGRFRGRSPVVLEIGIFHGGSLELWHEYFGAGCRLYAVDVDPECRKFEDENTRILIGDQADRGFLARLRQEVPRIDILIDDGGHRMDQQIATFEELFRHVSDEGIYLCEDMHTSYWKDFGGGYREPGSFVEYSKRLIDQLNAWHSREPGAFGVDDYTRAAYAMHYYDSVLAIEKRPVTPPRKITTGQPTR
jgi:hypothetical protein